jgi:sulfur transfer complex TusBCD TusB component (DsrH family)
MLSNMGIVVATIGICVFIFFSVVFDMLGVAAASADVDVFIQWHKQGIRGANIGLKLCENSEKVCSFCGDVVGDICSTLCGAAGTCIVVAITHNIITRSLGDSPVKAQPDYISRTLSDGDYILLCSDGLCGLCRDEEILQVMAASEDIESCKNALIKAALEAGGYDNVTVALLEVVSAGNEEVEAVADDTTNDFKNVKRRKRRNRLISALAIIVLLAGCAWWLHYTGRLSSILQSVSDKLELYLEDSSQPAAVEEEVQELEAAPDTVKVDTINIQ